MAIDGHFFGQSQRFSGGDVGVIHHDSIQRGDGGGHVAWVVRAGHGEHAAWVKLLPERQVAPLLVDMMVRIGPESLTGSTRLKAR